uniref:Uncharacterized protein n=1 Tax=Gossypium raimondii TaxID=29730 RepID=A0A0D2QY20_GOSRA|nr:hypothetical protein B456_004G025100 [Gossypium raimondii]
MLCSCMNPSLLVASHIKSYVLKTHIDMVHPTQNTLAIAQTKQKVVFLHPRSRSFQSNWKTSFTSS